MKSTFKYSLLLLSTCYSFFSVAESTSPASTKEWKQLSHSESNSLPCLGFNERAPYRVQVTFNQALHSKRAYKIKDFLITEKGLVPGRRGLNEFCQISLSSDENREVNLKASTPILASPLIATLSGFVDSRNSKVRGCRINLQVQDSHILSLQCFSKGKGDTTIGDLRSALRPFGEIKVLTYR